MKKQLLLFIPLLFLALFSQAQRVTVYIGVDNVFLTDSVVIGFESNATIGIDPLLGEENLWNVPMAPYDIRSTQRDEQNFSCAYETGEGINEIYYEENLDSKLDLRDPNDLSIKNRTFEINYFNDSLINESIFLKVNDGDNIPDYLDMILWSINDCEALPINNVVEGMTGPTLGVVFIPDGSETSKLIVQFKADTLPCFNLEASVGEDVNINLGDSTQLQLISNSMLESIIWTPDNSLSCNDCLEPYASPTEDECYTVSMADAAGCTFTDSVCVFVQVANNSKELTNSNRIKLFPNPSFEKLHIESSDYLISEVLIYDVLGQLVQRVSRVDSKRKIINIGDLASNVYFVEIRGQHFFERRKIIKK